MTYTEVMARLTTAEYEEILHKEIRPGSLWKSHYSIFFPKWKIGQYPKQTTVIMLLRLTKMTYRDFQYVRVCFLCEDGMIRTINLLNDSKRHWSEEFYRYLHKPTPIKELT